MIERRLALARQVPLASLIAAPDSEKGARFPVHAGAEAYLSDTDVSWYTLLSDQIWNVVLVGGILSSIFAVAAGFLKRSSTDPMRELLDHLRTITERARITSDPADVDLLRQDSAPLRLKSPCSDMNAAVATNNSHRCSLRSRIPATPWKRCAPRRGRRPI